VALDLVNSGGKRGLSLDNVDCLKREIEAENGLKG
jgi:hypothetical protein